jgi:hypothetical protein
MMDGGKRILGDSPLERMFEDAVNGAAVYTVDTAVVAANAMGVLAAFLSADFADCPNCGLRINGKYRNLDADTLDVYEGCASCAPVRAIFRLIRDMPRGLQTLLQLHSAERRFIDLEEERREAIARMQKIQEQIFDHSQPMPESGSSGYMEISGRWNEAWAEVERLRESAQIQRLI